MKTISTVTASSIEDFAAETELSLPAYALEKDHHVLDAIRMVIPDRRPALARLAARRSAPVGSGSTPIAVRVDDMVGGVPTHTGDRTWLFGKMG